MSDPPYKIGLIDLIRSTVVTTPLRFLATHLADDADRLAAALAPPPANLPPDVRITVLADYRRALEAAETAQLIAWGIVSWDTDYPHLAREADPQAAAAERALDEAQDAIADYRSALNRARTALVPAA
jgi:hypothetical protein